MKDTIGPEQRKSLFRSVPSEDDAAPFLASHDARPLSARVFGIPASFGKFLGIGLSRKAVGLVIFSLSLYRAVVSGPMQDALFGELMPSAAFLVPAPGAFHVVFQTRRLPL